MWTNTLKMITLKFIALVFLLANFADCLIIRPTTPLTLTVGGMGLYTCENPLSSSQPSWQDPISDPIYSGSSNRVYISESRTSEGHPVTQLHLRNVHKEDAGNYACKVDGQQTVTRNVIIVDPIRFTRGEQERSQRLLFNTTGTLECTVEPKEELAVTWTKSEGSGSVSNPSKYNSAVTGQLTVYNVIEADAGTYLCTGYYPDNSIIGTLDIDVVVQVPPTWQVLPRNRDGVINTGITLQCLADGQPQPTVTWVDRTSTTGANITETPNKYELSDRGSILRIVDLQLPPSGGNTYIIECTATNDPAGSKFRTSITKAVLLTVLVPPVLTSPVVLEVAESESRSVTFECANTNAGAEVELSFRRDGLDRMDILELGPQPDDQLVVVTRNPLTMALTLTISNVQREHEGIWTCYGESAAGNVYTDHILNVRYIPLIDQSLTPDRVVSWEGNPTNLTCTFNGFPTPTIVWFKNTQRLNATANIEFVPNLPVGTSVVRFKSATVQDFGAYFCNGSNREGFLNYRQEMIKAGKPSRPQAFSIVSSTSSTITIRFSPPLDDGGLPILGYVVSFWIAGNPSATDQEYDNAFQEEDLCRNVLPPSSTGNDRECFNYCEDTGQICCPFSTRKLCVNRPITEQYTDIRLTGLSGESNYVIRVAAKNQRSAGVFTENRTITTEAFSVPDAPQIISRRVSDFPDRYDLKWEAPLDDGGSDIIRYHIRYSQVDTRDTEFLGPRPVEDKADGTERHHEIYGLNKNMYYYIELRAENYIGIGVPASVNIETAGTFSFLTTPPMRPRNKGFLGLFNENHALVIVIVVLVVFFTFLVITDICCCCINDCGVLMFICVTCCGKTRPSMKEEIEMGEHEYGADSLKEFDSFNEMS